MADLKFRVVQNEDGQQYLGLEQQGEIRYVYRCVLHQHPVTALAIPSGLELPKTTASRWYNLIRDFAPLLYNQENVYFEGNRVVVDGVGDNFSTGNRSDIKHPGENTKHLRFRRWQIYLFQPTDRSKNPLHPGLWEGIKIDQPLPGGAFWLPPGYGP
jgi:hypothetical protein